MMFKNSLTSKGKTSSKIQFKKGDLVKLNINKVVSPESLTLCYTNLDSITLYEKIDLCTYPSYRDFKGYKKDFKEETLLVIEMVGRPDNFVLGDSWSLYDVYSVVFNGKKYECFGYVLEKVKDD